MSDKASQAPAMPPSHGAQQATRLTEAWMPSSWLRACSLDPGCLPVDWHGVQTSGQQAYNSEATRKRSQGRAAEQRRGDPCDATRARTGAVSNGAGGAESQLGSRGVWCPIPHLRGS